MLRALLLIACAAAPLAAATDDSSDAAADPARVAIAAIRIGEHRSDRCFNDAFIGEVAERSNLRVVPEFQPVTLGHDELFDHPFALLAGEKGFEISERQAAHLAAYLNRGGFLLASANCSAPAFDDSFRKALAAALPDAKLEPIDPEHPLMSTLFEIEKVRVGKDIETPPLLGVTINDRLAVLYSPVGLNDSYGMRAECCCCGQAEVLNARLINANALVYATTH